jgi:Flp pilus assembly protein TadD
LGDRAARLSLPEEDIFEITPEMRKFLKRYIPAGSSYSKLQRLMEVVMEKSFLGWEFDPFKTYGAADTFNNRKGNCISYSIMMTALGRELGLKMYFNEVHIPPTWDIQINQTVVLFRHVNVLTRAGGRRLILDLDIESYDSSYPQYRITDIAAEAHYYNNRGTDYLKADDMENAFLYFKKALTLQPDQAFIWVNMGVLYLRYGHHQEAESAFLRALALDPSELTAISNLQRLYVLQDNTELANYYKQEAELSRMKNPYYRYYLAQKLMDENQPDLALEHIKWAIREYKKEHRFYFIEAKIYSRLGRKDDAEKSLERAAELTKNEDSRLLYQSKISRLRGISGK